MREPSCPLCKSTQVTPYFEDRWRPYLQCSCCQLVFVPTEYHLSLKLEKAEYDLHQNSPQDPNYRRFLRRLYEPLEAVLSVPTRGLDFGCGPGPTLSLMLTEAGHKVDLYDPFYNNQLEGVLDHQDSADQPPYDFITASEVVEHLRAPGMELERLWSLLKPNGILGIMTKRVRNLESFSKWHYKNDRTHISFFSANSFQWLANKWSACLDFHGEDVVLIRKT
ncbi:MAG: class I SAM-dependent methyltransferase [Mariniblastus sp.]|nr:class I SAM-dependent methyltransferase [Mariniblastus sp.]